MVAEKGRHSLESLVKSALRHGIGQVGTVGSPLHPFIIDEAGKMYVLFDETGKRDPMAMALPAIRDRMSQIRLCALVIDTRITTSDGRKSDAIVVMACERDAEAGQVWAQRYVPKRLFRKFRVDGGAERVADTRNFIRAALEDASPGE